MSDKTKVEIEFQMGGEVIDLTFNVDIDDYNEFQDAAANPRSGAIEALQNLLATTVASNSDKALRRLILIPGAVPHVAETVIQEYQPKFEVRVKKSKATS